MGGAEGKMELLRPGVVSLPAKPVQHPRTDLCEAQLGAQKRVENRL